MEITFYGHAAFMIRMNGLNFLIDPFITPNPQAQGIDIKELKPDYILVTHGHGDHVADAEAIAKSSGAKLISNYEVTNWFTEKGVEVIPLNHGGKINLDGITIKYVNAVHSSQLPDGSDGGYPGGFVLWNDTECIYIAGDTALTMDMKLIPMTCPKLTTAILPIGDNFTMGYEDAAIASDFIDCNHIIGCHFNTFPPITIDVDAAKKLSSDRGKNLTTLDIGQKIEI